MNIVLWILASVLAVVFLAAGAMKATQPREKLASMGLGWTEDFSAGTVKLIGVLEVAAAIGLILPAVTGIAPIFVPLAALGLVLMMIGAAITHARRGENQMIIGNALILIVAAVVTWGRFGPYSF